MEEASKAEEGERALARLGHVVGRTYCCCNKSGPGSSLEQKSREEGLRSSMYDLRTFVCIIRFSDYNRIFYLTCLSYFASRRRCM